MKLNAIKVTSNQPYSFKQIKEHLRSKAPLKFQGIEKEDLGSKSVDSFLRDFFTYSERYATVYANTNRTQTASNKRRSIGDIYRITSYYFPKVKLTTVYKGMLKNIVDNNFFSYICKATHLRVYRNGGKDIMNNGGFCNGLMTDEYSVDLNQWNLVSEVHNTKGYGKEFGLDYLEQVKLS